MSNSYIIIILQKEELNIVNFLVHYFRVDVTYKIEEKDNKERWLILIFF